MKYTILICLSILFIASCNNSNNVSEETTKSLQQETTITLTEAQEKNAHIITGSALKKPVPIIINCNGFVDVPPQNLISVSSPIDAFVKDIPVLPGTHVHKGDLLVSFQHPEIITLQKNYLEANNKYNLLAKELERQNILYKEEAASKKILEQIQYDFETTKAVKNALQAQLKLMNIDVANLSADNMSTSISLYATENGYVAKVSANKGRFINMENEVMQIVNTSHLHAELQVFEKDIIHLKENEAIKISIAQDNAKVYDANIALIGSVINPETKTVTVHAHFNNESNNLKPGMYLNAQILANNQPVSSLPETALIRDNKSYYVFVKKQNSTYEKVLVEVISKTDSLFAIKLPAAIENSNQIVLEGAIAINNALGKEE